MSTTHHGRGKFQDLLKFFRIDRPQLYGNHRIRQQDFKRFADKRICCIVSVSVCRQTFDFLMSKLYQRLHKNHDTANVSSNVDFCLQLSVLKSETRI